MQVKPHLLKRQASGTAKVLRSTNTVTENHGQTHLKCARLATQPSHRKGRTVSSREPGAARGTHQASRALSCLLHLPIGALAQCLQELVAVPQVVFVMVPLHSLLLHQGSGRLDEPVRQRPGALGSQGGGRGRLARAPGEGHRLHCAGRRGGGGRAAAAARGEPRVQRSLSYPRGLESLSVRIAIKRLEGEGPSHAPESHWPACRRLVTKASRIGSLDPAPPPPLS